MILPPVFHSLEIKPMMFLHLLRSFGSKIAKLPHVLTFSSILHRVDHHFIMKMLFFLQFLHIFDPNLPTTPSVNWKFAVVSWLLGNHLHLKYGASHAEKEKHGFHPSAAPTKGKRPGCTRKKVSTRNVHHVRNPRLQDAAAPVQSHGTKVCTKPRHASNMCSYREIRSHCF